MNTTFPSIKAAAGGTDPLDFLNCKLRFVAIDADDAGPTPGAWKITSASFGGFAPTITVTLFTLAPHGFAVGDLAAILGRTVGLPTWSAGANLILNDYIEASPKNGKKYRVVKGGATGNNAPTFPTGDGEFVGSGGAILRCDGSATSNPMNRIVAVSAVPDPSSVRFVGIAGDGWSTGTGGKSGYLANLSKAYLSEFAPAVARSNYSDPVPLAGRTVSSSAVFDGSDVSLDLTGADQSEILLLLKTAALHADADLPDTQQELVNFYDTMPTLPFAANAGPVSLGVSNGADRLMRW